MKYILISVTVLVIFIGCRSNTVETVSKSLNDTIEIDSGIIESSMTIQQIKRTLVDSLNKYSQLTEKFMRVDERPEYTFYLREINKKKIALIVFTDSVFFLFQQISNKWIQTDSALFDSYAKSFGIDDLNGDNKDDFILYGFPNIHGQQIPFVFLSDKNKILHYRPDIHLYNIKFDKKTRLVKSFYYGGVYSIDVKELYKWEGDSLKFVRSAEYHKENSEKSYLEFHKLKDGKRFKYSQILDSTGNSFDTAIWKGIYLNKIVKEQ
jgi:hypothetical protein